MAPNMLLFTTLSKLTGSEEIKKAGTIFVYSDGGHFTSGS